MAGSISSTEKRRRGRPRTNPVAQHFTMSPQLSAALDGWIAGQPDPKPTRPEAIRRLIEMGLNVAAKASVTSPEVAATQGKGLPLTRLGASQQKSESGASKPAPRKPRAKPAA